MDNKCLDTHMAVYSFDDYKNFKDEEIIELIHNGDDLAQEFIIEKYKKLVKMKSRSYFIIGADREDIIQEGMIGLYKAIRDFDLNGEYIFYSFAELCVKRQIISAIKSASRQKHIPLNSSVSLNRVICDENDEKTYIELFADSLSNPEELFIGQEDKNYIEDKIVHNLSKLEYKVLSLYLKGKSYYEIANIINKDEKAIDNALQRVKKKIEKILIERKNLETKSKGILKRSFKIKEEFYE